MTRLVLALVLAGCGARSTAPSPPPEDPIMSTEEDPYAPTYGPVIEAEAVLVMAPIAGGKRLQPVTLVLDNGEEWIASYRPVPEYAPFVERRVHVKGRQYWPSNLVQHVMSQHFEIQEIALAEGETPAPVDESGVPTPVLVRESAALEARIGRWTAVVGTLTTVEPWPDNTSWSTATLALADGATLTLPALSGPDVARVSPWKGQTITVLGKVARDAGAVVLNGRAFCEGEDPRCGLDQARR